MTKHSSRNGGRGRDPSKAPFDAGRRRFLAGVAAATGALALPGCGDEPGLARSAASSPMRVPTLPKPEDSGIDHIVQVMMENRSFDHMLGWVPGADGVQAGLSYKNVNGDDVATFHLAPDADYGYQGCGWADPAHGYDTGRVHYNDGKMDGFLITPGTSDNPADKFPVGYYTAEDLKFYKGVAENFTVCDRYFHAVLASTFPNRIYMHAGATDRLDNSLQDPNSNPPAPSSLPTIWDRLAAKGLTGRNYFSDLPLTAIWGARYAGITAPYEQFLADAAHGAAT